MTDPMELVGRLESFDGGHQKDAYSLIDEAAACIREMVEWRPIETAPRDPEGEIYILAMSPSGRPYVVYEGWQKDDGSPVWFDGDVTVDATHWLPIPTAPGAEA